MADTLPPPDRESTRRQPVPNASESGDAPSRPRVRLGSFTPRSDRSSRAGVLSVIGHVAAALFLLRAITFDTNLVDLFGLDRSPPSVERLTFVETTPPVEEVPTAAPREARPPVAPAVVTPNRGPVLGDGGGTPAVAAPPRLVAPSDSSPVRALTPGEAAVTGIVPRGDDRLWTLADLLSLRDEVRAIADGGSGNGMPGARALDSVITWTLASARDSLDSLAVIQNMGPLVADWTKTDSKGGRWGMDAGGIRLGKVTVPSMLIGYLLGSIPSLSGNPIASDRARRLSYAQSDIARFRNSGPGNDQFKMLVQELRERRDREREERRKLIAAPKVAGPDDPPH